MRGIYDSEHPVIQTTARRCSTGRTAEMSGIGSVRLFQEDRISDFMTHCVSREHVADIAKHGFILTGDCASLPGLDRRLAAAMGIPVRIYSEWAGVFDLTNPVSELAS